MHVSHAHFNMNIIIIFESRIFKIHYSDTKAKHEETTGKPLLLRTSEYKLFQNIDFCIHLCKAGLEDY
jgi:hypothetical protein